jgi:DNA modification methylase
MKQQVKISKVKGNPDNPRIIKNDKFKKLVKSIQEFPEMLKLRPIVVDEDFMVLGGNMRLKASKDAGLKEVWIEVAEGLTEEQKKEFIVKDNVGFGEWEWDMLANEWDSVQLAEWGLDVWENEDDKIAEAGLIEDDEIPEVKESKVKRGDIWQLGEHRLMCGDSTSSDDVEKLMNGEKADMVFTDPPYGIGYDNEDRWNGIKKQNSKAKRNKNKIIIGDDKDFDPSFILTLFSYVKEIFIWGFQYYPHKLGRGGIIVWNRKTETQKDVPHTDFELCWSKQERNKMAWITWGGFKNKEKGEDRLHTTQKPIELAEWFFNNWGKESNLIIDLFLGSGSTLIAAEKLNRKCYGMELDEKYCDVIIERWEQFTGQKAIKNGTE